MEKSQQASSFTIQELPFWRRISFKILTFAILGTLLPLVLVVLISFSLSRQALERDSYESLDGIADQKLERVIGWLDASRNTLDIISENTTTFTRIFQASDDNVIGLQVASNYLAAVAEDDPNIKDF